MNYLNKKVLAIVLVSLVLFSTPLKAEAAQCPPHETIFVKQYLYFAFSNVLCRYLYADNSAIPGMQDIYEYCTVETYKYYGQVVCKHCVNVIVYGEIQHAYQVHLNCGKGIVY